ncbi:MAG: hypothetical protein DRO62_03345 [Candidatus Altiarchaeales archaeon]|nr:MAG: hypothetical protein DRO62_03345 [Candidatus Altiarchaeales archaeon]
MYYMDKKFLAVITVGFLILLIGCIGEEKLTAEQVRDRSQEAMEKVETYAFDMDISMLMKGGEISMMGAKEITMSMSGKGKVDEKNKKMHAETTMSMSGMTMEMEQYIIGDTQYMKIPMLGWVKNRTSEDIWSEGSYANLVKDMGVELLDDEKVDGKDCYVLEIKPKDISKIFEVITQQMGSTSTLTAEDLESVKDVGFKEWIAKDTFLVRKMFVNLQMEKDNTAMDMSMTMRFYDYDEPMKIILPEEAEKAIDMESMAGGMIPTK